MSSWPSSVACMSIRARDSARRPRTRVLSTRVLGRLTLERQLLLQRVTMPVVEAVEQIFGLNAQNADPPSLALWSRLAAFTSQELNAAIAQRLLVRSTLMRATQHLVSVADFTLMRPLVAPLLRRVQRNAFGRRTAGVDLDALVVKVRDLLADGRVLTRPELGRLLARHWPGVESTALGWTAQYLVPLIHPAVNGTWTLRGATPFALADWTGVRPTATVEDAQRMVRRYLMAFGPASVADIRAWSGISGLREVVEGMRSELRVYTDPSGRELFDLADAPAPPGDVADIPAPVRFLPEFDAVVLAYADRTRVMTDQVRRQVCVGASVAATVLVDGTVAAMWSRTTTRDTVVVTIHPFRSLSRSEHAAVEQEAHQLLAFTDPDAAVRQVRFQPAP